MSVLIRTFACAVLAAALALPAYAGGDDYEAMNDADGKGPAYFGFVRDTRGSPVPNAEVVLRPKKGEPVVLKSNVLGIYHSHVTKEVPPADVEVICGKTGYILETGWPSSGKCFGDACAGPEQQAEAIKSIKDTIGDKCVFFSLHDDKWKKETDCQCEQHWGMSQLFSTVF